LAEVGRTDEALDEYHALAAYFPGAEARVRYGMLLKLVGRTAEARVVFNELLLQMRRAPRYCARRRPNGFRSLKSSCRPEPQRPKTSLLNCVIFVQRRKLAGLKLARLS